VIEHKAVLARNLGADETINFKEEAVAAYVDRVSAGRGFDVVFDTIGGDNLKASFAATAYEGRVSTTNARTTQDLSPLHSKGLSLNVVFMLLPMLRGAGRERHGLILRNIARLVEQNELRPLLDESHFTLETAPDAYRRLASGKAQGKVVIEIATESEPAEAQAVAASSENSR
jgi:NADPH:quinone reductase